MAAHAAGQGVALRPHAKTHKAPELARRQLAAGATGLTVATVGEAEVFVDAGATDVFIAYPLWTDGDLAARLAALAERARLLVGVDSAASAERLPAGSEVAVEVDCGLRRSGVIPRDAGPVAAAAAAAGCRVAGVFTFPGHSYAPGAAAGALADEGRALEQAAASLAAAGLPCELRSGGCTPTAPSTPGGVVTELRPGVYVFNDAQQVALGTADLDDVALCVAATVVSVPAADRVVLDAGSKVLGPERPPWVPGHGLLPEHPGAVVSGLWEHHAVVDPGPHRLRLGDRVAVVPNHVCTAVNLATELLVASGGEVVDRWAVTARSRNR